MADTEALPPPSSIRDRIAALNLNQVGRASPPTPSNTTTNSTCNTTAAAAPPPPRPFVPPRPSSIPPPQSNGYAATSQHIGNLPDAAPAVPPRRPNLPPRTSSGQSSQQAPSIHRKNSGESIASVASVASSRSFSSSAVSSHLTPTTSRTAAPPGRRPSGDSLGGRNRVPLYDAAQLPSLPARRSDSIPSVTGAKHNLPPPVSPNIVPPAVALTASRPPLPTRNSTKSHGTPAAQASLESLPVPPKRRSPLEGGFGTASATTAPPPVPFRPSSVPPAQVDGPPPIPLGSRPNLAALQASKPKFNPPVTTSTPPPPSIAIAAPQSSGSGVQSEETCLLCRDFTDADNHAAQFPRETLPSTDLAWLAQQLTSPFHSATDKARVIFTWLHHNIDYNVNAFFSGNVRSSTPASTLQTGLAVCEGYAGLFAALAMHAGLEAVVVGGSGKGFGHRALQPGEPIPPMSTNHAWNAVRIDGGNWKLIDACWGAGHVQGANKPYKRHFTPEMFTMPNSQFALKHFPADPSYFFFPNNQTLSWEEFILGPNGPGDPVQIYTGCGSTHGLDESSFLPAHKTIAIRGKNSSTRIRFSMRAVCPHMDRRKKPFVYVLSVGGYDGRKRREIPFEPDGPSAWFVDVPIPELGCGGQMIYCYAVTTVGNRTGRGMRVEDYKTARRTMGSAAFEGIAAWTLAA